MKQVLLIVGGEKDPNIKHLIEAAKSTKTSFIPLLIADNSSPSFFWDVTSSDLFLMKKKILPTAVFIRRNVFHSPGNNNHDRALAWYTALTGWAAVNTEISALNRQSITTYSNKLNVLDLAATSGLPIPASCVTNDMQNMKALVSDSIAKPVMGGGYCHPLESLLSKTESRSGSTANPAIVQQRIRGDDIRIYRVGKQYFGFRILSDEVDYRKTTAHEIKPLATIPEHAQKGLENLMNRMRLDWGAADFKECNKSGKWYFLEVNSNPMFSVFDKEAEGKISKAIFTTLLSG